jgi:hypothetical protein
LLEPLVHFSFGMCVSFVLDVLLTFASLLCYIVQVMRMAVKGLEASLTPGQVADAFAEASCSSSSGNNWAAEVLWYLFKDTKPQAAKRVLVQAAQQAARHAALAAFAKAGGAYIGMGEQDALLAASYIGELPQQAGPRCNGSADGVEMAGFGKLAAVAHDVFLAWARDQQVDGAGVHAVAVAAAEAVARVCRMPWLGFNSQTLSHVLGSLQLDLAKVKWQDQELLGGWEGVPGGCLLKVW